MKSKLALILILLLLSLSMLLTSCTSDITDNDGSDANTEDVEGDDPEDGNPNAGNPNDGDPDDGDPDDGDPDDGNPDDGNPNDGDPDDGNPDDGDPDDGDPNDGNPDDGNPDDGNPDDGDPNDGNPDDGNSEGNDPEGGESEPDTTPEGYGLVPESAAVDKSYFDDAAFIGDSISLKLKTYCINGALGKANFFTVGSFNTVNALKPVSSSSTHPSYQGTKMLAEDCVAACGAKKVYIMLGMNDLNYGIDETIERYKTLVSRILAKSPDAEIFVQSMTPMRNDSRVWGSKLNNTNIRTYNAKLLETCKEMGWYYIDVQSVMWDDAGEQMRLEYCSDAGSGKMGMHMSTKGCKAWVDYLLAHTVDFSEQAVESDNITENGET